MHFIFVKLLLAQLPPVAPSNGDDIGWILSTLKWMVTQFQSHNAWPAVAMGIMMVVWAAKTFLLSKLNSKVLPWFSMSLGVLAGIGTSMLAVTTGSTPTAFLDAALHGALLGAAASGLWEMIGQHIEAWLKSKFGIAVTTPPPSK